MFPMRLKIGPSRNNEWRCFFCLHVRTATTLLGIWHLMLHVLALSILALLMRNHHNYYEKGIIRQQEYDNILPTPLSKTKNEDNPYYLPTIQDSNNRIHEADMDMGALMTVCTLAITLLLVYGTVKGKASHLLPFFCLQLFDFAIATLTATGYFVYLRSVHNFVKEHWHTMPFRKELLQLSPQWLSLVVITSFFLCMMWKAYCISIVWRCYKYLTLRQQATHSTVHYILPGEAGERVPEPDYSSLLPDYEAACASAMKQPPPPSYQAAMAAQLPTYPEAIHVVSVNEHEPQQLPPAITITTIEQESVIPGMLRYEEYVASPAVTTLSSVIPGEGHDARQVVADTVTTLPSVLTGMAPAQAQLSLTVITPPSVIPGEGQGERQVVADTILDAHLPWQPVDNEVREYVSEAKKEAE